MSLYLKLAGENGNRKISVHAFSAALSEFFHGHLSGQGFIAMFELEGDEVADAIRIKDLIKAAPKKVSFMRIFKDTLYLMEGNYIANDEDAFWKRLEDAVIEQGGSV